MLQDFALNENVNRLWRGGNDLTELSYWFLFKFYIEVFVKNKFSNFHLYLATCY